MVEVVPNLVTFERRSLSTKTDETDGLSDVLHKAQRVFRPRDRIYALLGIATDSERFAIDYSLLKQLQEKCDVNE
jgi:hypothetical protein